MITSVDLDSPNFPARSAPRARRARIALVLVWLGPWKPWINLFVESCRYNPGFDFLVFTNQAPPQARAENVRFIPRDQASLQAAVRERILPDAVIATAYKLCDYKPAYGLLFADALAGYEWWGYCDEDLIWGRIEDFIPPKVLAAHDIVTSCRCCIVGQLTILRNRSRINTLFQRVPGWRELLHHPNTTNLAETIIDRQARVEEAAGELRVWRQQIQTHDVHDEEWSRWANQLELAETGRPHPPLLHGAAMWRAGRVYHLSSRREYAFFHFKLWKTLWALPPIPPPPPEVNEWIFTDEGVRFEAEASVPVARDFVRRHRRFVRRARQKRRAADLRKKIRGWTGRVLRSLRRRFRTASTR